MYLWTQYKLNLLHKRKQKLGYYGNTCTHLFLRPLIYNAIIYNSFFFSRMEECYGNPYLLWNNVMTFKGIENINEFRENVTPSSSSFLVPPHQSDLWMLLLPRLSLMLSSWSSDLFLLHILPCWLQSHGFKHHLYTVDSHDCISSLYLLPELHLDVYWAS